MLNKDECGFFFFTVTQLKGSPLSKKNSRLSGHFPNFS